MDDQRLQPNSDVLWKQYNMLVDLYKFYLEIALKANAFFYLITGGILTFYFANSGAPFIKYSLFFPTILGFGLAGVFLYGASQMDYIREELFSIRDQLGLDVAPDVQVLRVFLRIFALILAVVSVAMVVLVFIRK